MFFALLVLVNIWSSDALPSILTTWEYPEASDIAFDTLLGGGSHIDALVDGCDVCDRHPELCRFSVGPGRPNEEGETTLDAMIMDGMTHAVGAVGCLKRVQQAARVARAVMDHTAHSLLVGEDATQFALNMGFNETSLETDESIANHEEWVEGNCQPNSWKDVLPNPTENCGPYSPVSDELPSTPTSQLPSNFFSSSADNHDTIGMVVIDDGGRVAAGTSTNGLAFKIPGRVGDSPIPGSGAYADGAIGGAAATGNGDVMMRFVPSFAAVAAMGEGLTPTEAAEQAVAAIAAKYPEFSGAVIAMNKDGAYGAACYGYEIFPFTVRDEHDDESRFEYVDCITL